MGLRERQAGRRKVRDSDMADKQTIEAAAERVIELEAELESAANAHTGDEALAYAARLDDNPDLWCRWSEKYINWRQLEILGLMSKGNWA